MGENGLPLTEQTVAGCEKVDCPWLENGLCGLAGQLLIRMNTANIKSQGSFILERGDDLPSHTDWVVGNHKKFLRLGDGCVISQMNQEQLIYNNMTNPLILVAGDQEQYEINTDYTISQRHQMLRVTPNDESRSVLVSRVIFSPDIR